MCPETANGVEPSLIGPLLAVTVIVPEHALVVPIPALPQFKVETVAVPEQPFVSVWVRLVDPWVPQEKPLVGVQLRLVAGFVPEQ